MLYKRAQEGIREVIMTLVVAGVIAIVGMLIFANVSNTSKDIFPKDSKTAVNESVTITSASLGGNSTLLTNAGYKENTEVVRNQTSPFVQLVRNIDYRVIMTGASGDLSNRANFTLINSSANQSSSEITGGKGFNGTALYVSYDYNSKSAAQTTSDKVDDTALDSFELGVIALIVLAATAVLGTIMYLGK